MGFLGPEAGYMLRDHMGNETTEVNLVSETLQATDSTIRDCLRQQYNTDFWEEEINGKRFHC
jgi:hypothetical protein